MTDAKRLLRPREAATVLRVSVWTLKNWRRYGGGPPYAMIGRQVRYELAEVLAWANKRGIHGEQ